MSAPAASASTGTRRCYHCKGTGHMAKDCAQAPQKAAAAVPAAHAPAAPAAPVAAASAEPSSSSGGTRKCYHCGLAGHMAKDCSQAPKKDGAARSTGASAAAPRPTAAAAAKKDEPSFKDRLAEYKAKIDPTTGVKPLFCYLCGKEGHRERDCPKNSKKKDEEKACLRCGEEGHIARVCPTIANRTLYRDETKDRKAGCYICSEEGHHAEECPQLTVLAEEFAKFVAKVEGGIKLHAKVYNVLLEKCSKALEINGALYLFDLMQTKGVTPTEESYKSLEYLHDRSGKDQSKLECIAMKPKRVAKLKEIVSSWKRERKMDQTASEILPHIVAHLRLPSVRSAAESCKSLFDLAKYLKAQSIAGLEDPLSNLSARTALSTLKALGRYHQASSKAEFDLDGTITNPGRFAKKADASPAAASAKKKSKSSKKKQKSSNKKADGGAAKKDGEGEDSDDGAAEKPKQSEQKKGSKRKGASTDAEGAAAEAEAKPAASAAASTKGAKKAKTAAAAASVKKESAAAAPAAATEPATAARKKQKGASGAVAKEEQPEAESAAAAATTAGADKKKRKAKA